MRAPVASPSSTIQPDAQPCRRSSLGARNRRSALWYNARNTGGRLGSGTCSAAADARGGGGEAAASAASTLDSGRLIITLVSSALTIGLGLNSGVVDALSAVVIASLVSATALLTTQRWVRSAWNLLARTPSRASAAAAADDTGSSGFGMSR